MKILIKNGKVINSDKELNADILIDGGKISLIKENINIETEFTIEASNKLVIPGGIDVHTHLDMPYGDIKTRDDFETGTIAAAFGGTTSIIDFAIQSKGQTLKDSLNIWLDKGKNAVLDFGLHLIITDVNPYVLSEIKEVIEKGVTSFKLFTAYPNRLMLSDEKIFQVMLKASENGGLILMHAENGEAIEYLINQALQQGKKEPIYHALTRPSQLEAEAVYRSIMLASLADVPIYFVHISSGDAMDVINFSKQRYEKIFSETCPHYLLLTEDELREPNFEGAKYVLSPPLRKKADLKRLWSAIQKNEIDTIATDHCPLNFETDKKLGVDDFTKIPNGGPGIENRVQLMYHFGVVEGKISLNRWVELISTNPAKIFGLYPEKGTISVGSDADIVIWNPDAEHTISASTHHMNVDYNMFEGFKIKGNAEVVISNGEIIIQNNKFVGRRGRGKFLKRKQFELAR